MTTKTEAELRREALYGHTSSRERRAGAERPWRGGCREIEHEPDCLSSNAALGWRADRVTRDLWPCDSEGPQDTNVS